MSKYNSPIKTSVMIKVIHNNSCPNSKAILEYLDENDIKFQIIDIAKNPLSLFELRTLFKKLNKKPSKVLRKSAELYKKYFSEEESVSEEKALEVIALNPEVIQCPILIKGKIAMPGNPLENVKFFIEN
ncbi:arsenate reductase [Epilithonimonas bovis DSM 19482]|uniref:Arsenate reductase n=2 Tax=Epilithonimonas TaxID=2782229 RepID=A0A1U7PYX9_9FLAO|nr:arsenate reductase (glutaredoxin) [Chryseobacterium sp. NEB161]SIT97202.1 arsenate reductase [Epilithonimonas bovis DSM 19482]